MTASEKQEIVPNLPDESEYPAELTAQYELLECLSLSPDAQTLLVVHKERRQFCVVKCYLKDNLFYDRSEPEQLRCLDAAPMPRFSGEYRNDLMRCVVRDYIPGETLAALARERRFTREETLQIGLTLCDQLHALHSAEHPIIHRDIKPQNVIMKPDGTAVLIDFGISRVHSDNETDTVAFGTQGFAPPEQYGFSQTDSRSDIYSLGMLLHWLLYQDTKNPGCAGTPLDRVILERLFIKS